MQKKALLTAAVIVVLLCIWRMFPHPLHEIIPAVKSGFTSVSVQVSEAGIRDHSPYIDVYKLNISSPEDSCYSPVMSIMEGAKFRSDFRNLLPRNVLSADSGRKNITHSAIITLTWGSAADETCSDFSRRPHGCL